VKDDAVLLGRDARAAFQLTGFFAPACLSLFLATGGENERATVSLLIAAVASIAGYLELRRNSLVSEVLLLAAVGFTGAGLAWLVDPHLVWLIWAVAAAATLVVGIRTRSELVRWSSEALTAIAVFSFIRHLPEHSWVSLFGIAVFGLLLAFREDWERVADHQKFRRILGILGVAIAVLAIQNLLPNADSGWPWLVLLLVSAIRFRPALLWAVLPGYLVTCVVVVFWRYSAAGASPGWAAAWAALLVLINSAALWRLIGREGAGVKFLRYVLPFITAVIAFAFVHNATDVILSQGNRNTQSAWHLALLWSVGATLLVGLTAAWRRLGSIPSDLSWAAFGGLVGFLIQGMVKSGSSVDLLELEHSLFILLGLASMLHVLVVHTREEGAQRAFLGAVALLGTFIMLANLPGAGVSLFWALASVLTFVIGHLLATRSLRMVGLVGLAIATIRVLSHDITDMLGRIAACTALAVAFFGVAWLYGRITADKKDA